MVTVTVQDLFAVSSVSALRTHFAPIIGSSVNSEDQCHDVSDNATQNLAQSFVEACFRLNSSEHARLTEPPPLMAGHSSTMSAHEEKVAAERRRSIAQMSI